MKILLTINDSKPTQKRPVPEWVNKRAETQIKNHASRYQNDTAQEIFDKRFTPVLTQLTETERQTAFTQVQLWVNEARSHNRASLVRGTISQYMVNGNSACSFTSVKAAEGLLEKKRFQDIQSSDIDSYVNAGAQNWRSEKQRLSHEDGFDVIEVIGSSTYEGSLTYAGDSLTKMDLFLYQNPITTNTQNWFALLLDHAKTYTNQEFPFAITVTASGMTVAVIVQSNDEFWLFDSHTLPVPNETTQRNAFIEKFNKTSALQERLDQRFNIEFPIAISPTVLVKKMNNT